MLALSSCFTGVESTPKITYSDVKKEKIPVSKEQSFLSEAVPAPPAQWQPGKKFYVADPKISIVFTTASSADINDLYGRDISFHSMYPVTSVTGEEITEIAFVTPDGGSLFYRDNMPYAELEKRSQLEIPFTIEESVISAVADKIKGQKYYVVTSLWYTPDGSKAVNGLRHVPVMIEDVLPGNAVYPVRVMFRNLIDERQFSMYMTVGNQRSATRNFHTLFAFDNPRSKYPQISDETWDMIIHSQIKTGMTRDECRLALGAPQTIGQRPAAAGMVEYWSYSDGVYLLFEDGYLSYYRR